VTSRAAIEAKVMVTERMKPLRLRDRTIHQVWLPYRWGSVGLVTGDSANDLFGASLDPNVLIQETKVAICDVVAGRRPRGQDLLEFVQGYRQRAGITVETGARIATAEPIIVKAHVESASDSATDSKDGR
jgi:formate dehydrogenase major subunit